MGWTFTHRPKGMTDREFFTPHIAPFKLVEIGRGGNTVYMAVEVAPGQIVAYVFLTQRAPKDPDYNFGYKGMDETVGPYYYNCPEKVLNALTPTDNEYALTWRSKCREYYA